MFVEDLLQVMLWLFGVVMGERPRGVNRQPCNLASQRRPFVAAIATIGVASHLRGQE